MSCAVFKARCEAIRQVLSACQDRPLPAIELANVAGIALGDHESKRRRVRDVIQELRDQGMRICAGFRPSEEGGGDLGYWLAESPDEWAAYLESRRSNARFAFARVRQMAWAAREAQRGQGNLFEGSEANRQHGSAATEWAKV